MSSIKTQQTISLFTESFLRRRKLKLPFFRGGGARFPSFQQIHEGASFPGGGFPPPPLGPPVPVRPRRAGLKQRS